MTTEPAGVTSDDRGQLRAGIVKRLIQLLGSLLVQALILFLCAGDIGWTAAWIYVIASLLLMALNAVILLPRHPELIAERGRLAQNAQRWDKLLMIPMIVFSLATLAVAGLDRRFGWTPRLDWTIPGAGLILFFFGYGLVSWALASNPFFSSVVRIQTERGHTVATGGPYARIRHPGYLGMLVSILGTVALLGSWWALVAVAPYALTLVTRTILEDRMLQEQLPGYREYAARVRRRLVPGIW
jgi:protein-S-isoprenylcysteine O-methyltransferase Ste14